MAANIYIKDDFKSLLEYREWVNEKMQNLTRKSSKVALDVNVSSRKVDNFLKDRPNWFGEGVTRKELEQGITEYKKPQLIQEVYDQIDKQLDLDIKNKIKSPIRQFNSLGMGVFSFDRAAMTLYRNKEWYSQAHKRKVEMEEVNQIKDTYLLRIDNTPVIQRWEQDKNGRPKIRTHTKELFAYFPDVENDRQAVELIISCGGPNSVKADEFLYSGIAAIIITKILLKAKVKVKISIAIGTSSNHEFKDYTGCLIPAKNYNEPLDENIILLLSSDPRFYRYDGFKGIVATYDFFGRYVRTGLGIGPNYEQIEKLFEESGYADENILAANRYYFGRNFSQHAVIEQIEDTVTDLAEKFNRP